VSWAELEAGAPDIAALTRKELDRTQMVLVGTLRRDGSPRISCVQPAVIDGELYLGMMWRSRKAVDLLRDPRLVLHNAICTNTGAEVEVSLTGRAVDVRDPDERRRFVSAVAETTRWEEPHFHLFRVEIDSAGIVRYERGEQYVKVWPRDVEFRRPYG
jgi:pyridoxamine 5'-phosphate oxidase-like protein